MFQDVLSVTPFTTPAADSFFEHISSTGCFPGGDASFISTLRALYGRRIPEGESINLVFSAKSVANMDFSSFGKKDVFPEFCHDVASGKLNVVSLLGSKEQCAKAFAKLVEVFPTEGDWAEHKAVRALFRAEFHTALFCSMSMKAGVLFVESPSLKILHYVQSAASAFFPWYMQSPLTEEDIALLSALRRPDSAAYVAVLGKLAAGYDFELAHMKHQLGSFEQQNDKRRKDAVEREIMDENLRVESLMAEVAERIQRINNRNTELMGLELKLSQDGESELLGYFLRNRNVVFERVDGSVLTFGVKGTMSYFDEALVKRSAHRLCASYQSGPIHSDDMEKLINAVFIDQTVKLRVCAAFTLDLNGRVDAPSGYSYGPAYRGYMPNTHLDNHSCLGNYHGAIVQFMRRRDYVGAVAQCEASARSLNFGDGVVMRGFFYKLYQDDEIVACFELPDGRVVKPSEAIAWLKEEEVPAEKKEGEDVVE